MLASLELGKRVYLHNNYLKKIKIKCTNDVYDNFYNLFNNKHQEELLVIFLNTKNVVIDYKFIFKGSLNQSIIHPREIFKEAVKVSASSLIIIHNHPSGDVTPSKDDIEVTKRIMESGVLLGIPIIDHIIFGDKKYYSFLEKGEITYE